MDHAVIAYVLYLLVAVPLTIWVDSTLARNGRVFLVDVFDGNDELAEAVNKLLVVVHLTNVHVFTKIRRRSRLDVMAAPPVPPQGWTQPFAAPQG